MSPRPERRRAPKIVVTGERPTPPKRRAAMSRPAETAGAGGAVALLAGYVLGIKDPQTLVVLGAALGLIPGFVTWLVTNGGVRGSVRMLWRGRAK